MCNVVKVDRQAQTVLFQDGHWSVMIYKNRIISKSGSLTPVESNICFKKYNAIFPKRGKVTKAEAHS